MLRNRNKNARIRKAELRQERQTTDRVRNEIPDELQAESNDAIVTLESARNSELEAVQLEREALAREKHEIENSRQALHNERMLLKAQRDELEAYRNRKANPGPGKDPAPTPTDEFEYGQARELRKKLGWKEVWLSDHYLIVNGQRRRHCFQSENERIADAQDPKPSEFYVIAYEPEEPIPETESEPINRMT